MKFWTLKIFVGHVTFVMEIFLDMGLYIYIFGVGHEILDIENFCWTCIFCHGKFFVEYVAMEWRVFVGYEIFGHGKFCWTCDFDHGKLC